MQNASAIDYFIFIIIIIIMLPSLSAWNGHSLSIPPGELITPVSAPRASQVGLVVTSLPTQETFRDAGSIPGLGGSPGGGHGNPLQYSCLENPMDRGAWLGRGSSLWVAQSRTRLKRLSAHTSAPVSNLHTPLLSPLLTFCVCNYPSLLDSKFFIISAWHLVDYIYEWIHPYLNVLAFS